VQKKLHAPQVPGPTTTEKFMVKPSTAKHVAMEASTGYNARRLILIANDAHIGQSDLAIIAVLLRGE